MDKPYYVIDFSAVKCMIDIRINDVSVLSMNVDGQISTILPVNNAILASGKQEVSYIVLPLPGEGFLHDDANFSASVWLYDASGATIEKQEELTKFLLSEIDTSASLPSYKYEDTFYANVPYSINAWQNSIDLNNVDNLRGQVDSVYRNIERMINNRQYGQFIQAIQKREDNIATCMYLSASEKNERITELIEIINSGFMIVPVSDADIQVIYGHDKLVTLRKPDGSSSLLLANPTTGDELNLELQLHLEKDSLGLTII